MPLVADATRKVESAWMPIVVRSSENQQVAAGVLRQAGACTRMEMIRRRVRRSTMNAQECVLWAAGQGSKQRADVRYIALCIRSTTRVMIALGACGSRAT